MIRLNGGASKPNRAFFRQAFFAQAVSTEPAGAG